MDGEPKRSALAGGERVALGFLLLEGGDLRGELGVVRRRRDLLQALDEAEVLGVGLLLFLGGLRLRVGVGLGAGGLHFGLLLGLLTLGLRLFLGGLDGLLLGLFLGLLERFLLG